MRYALLALVLVACDTPQRQSTPLSESDSLVTYQSLTAGGLSRFVDRRYGTICYAYRINGGHSISCLPLQH